MKWNDKSQKIKKLHGNFLGNNILVQNFEANFCLKKFAKYGQDPDPDLDIKPEPEKIVSVPQHCCRSVFYEF